MENSGTDRNHRSRGFYRLITREYPVSEAKVHGTA